jgi:outer membrane protein assembly factor BamB
MCGMWSLWNSRNDRRHGKNAINPKLTIDLAVDVCFQLLSDGLQCYEQASGQKLEHYKTPPSGFLKVNTDGAYSASNAVGATGVVIRSDDGSFIQASARRLDPVASALIAEAEAFRDGIRLIPP